MSAASTREYRKSFRGKPRPGRRVEVEYRVGDGAPVSAYTRNIGVGGAFIVTNTPPAPGTTITIVLHVPTVAQPIEVKAEVRWQGKSAEGQATHLGMGVKFFGLEVDRLLELNEYFASQTCKDEAQVL